MRRVKDTQNNQHKDLMLALLTTQSRESHATQCFKPCMAKHMPTKVATEKEICLLRLDARTLKPSITKTCAANRHSKHGYTTGRRSTGSANFAIREAIK